MSSHTRTNFGADLSAVRSEVMQMGLLARQAAAEAFAALARRDADLARRQIERDHKIDVMHRRIETKAIETIARR